MESEIQKWKAYPELILSCDKENYALDLKVPWMKIETQLNSDSFSYFEDVFVNLNDIDTHHTYFEKASVFLSHFSSYPIAFAVPKKSKTKEFCLRSFASLRMTGLPRMTDLPRMTNMLSMTPRDLLRSIDASINFEVPESFLWNWEDVLHHSSSEDKHFDPLSVYTVIRRLSLLYAAEQQKEGQKAMDALKTLLEHNPESFRIRMAHIIRDIHYITQNCEASLKPALESFPQAKALLTEYLKDEEAHDLLMADSLKHLGFANPLDLPVSKCTQIIMQILKFAAQENPLALSTILAHFEGVPYSQMDSPLAQLLDASPWKAAGRGLRKHLSINQMGQHSSMGFLLANQIPSVDYQTVYEALRLTELFCDFKERAIFTMDKKTVLSAEYA